MKCHQAQNENDNNLTYTEAGIVKQPSPKSETLPLHCTDTLLIHAGWDGIRDCSVNSEMEQLVYSTVQYR